MPSQPGVPVLALSSPAWEVCKIKQKLIIFSLFLLGVFILAGCAGDQRDNSTKTQFITVRVTSSGYFPEVPEVKKGIPMVLNFQAASDIGCASYMEIPDFGISQRLEPNKTTLVEIAPREAGDFVIRCSMNMFSTT